MGNSNVKTVHTVEPYNDSGFVVHAEKVKEALCPQCQQNVRSYQCVGYECGDCCTHEDCKYHRRPKVKKPVRKEKRKHKYRKLDLEERQH